MITKVELDHVTGNGKDSFDQVIWNHGAVKLIVGDSFIEVIRTGSRKILANMINISPERVKVVYVGSRIKRYEIWEGKTWVKKRID